MAGQRLNAAQKISQGKGEEGLTPPVASVGADRYRSCYERASRARGK